MSLASWIEEYYPDEAEDVRASDSLAHSLQKFKGLTKDSLKRHEVEVILQEGKSVVNIDRARSQIVASLDIMGGTCALCIHYDRDCDDCPLGFFVCSCNENPDTPWGEWIYHNDPSLMLEALGSLCLVELDCLLTDVEYYIQDMLRNKNVSLLYCSEKEGKVYGWARKEDISRANLKEV